MTHQSERKAHHRAEISRAFLTACHDLLRTADTGIGDLNESDLAFLDVIHAKVNELVERGERGDELLRALQEAAPNVDSVRVDESGEITVTDDAKPDDEDPFAEHDKRVAARRGSAPFMGLTTHE